MPFRGLFHLHTRHSFDSCMSPATILGKARQHHVDVLVVTDHNSLQGSLDLRAIAEGNPRFVLIAGEYQTEKGDLIGLFLSKEIRSRDSGEVIRQIKEQNGLLILPHPFKAHKLDDELLAGVDLIETHNSRCCEAENASARQLAERLGKPFIGGADAHCAGELNSAFTNFSADLPSSESQLRELLLTATRSIDSRSVSGVYRPFSQIIRAFKTRDPLLFLSQTKRLVGAVFRETIG